MSKRRTSLQGSLSPSSRFVAVSLWPTLLHELRRLLLLWQEVSAAGSLQWDSAAAACLDILECLWTTAPDSWSFQAWAFRAVLSPIAEMPSDLGVREVCALELCFSFIVLQARAHAILALATSNIMLLDHALQSIGPVHFLLLSISFFCVCVCTDATPQNGQ